MVKKALAELKEKKGTSRPALLKYIMSHFNLGENATKVGFFARFKSATVSLL